MFTGVCHLSHPEPDESTRSNFFKIHFNIILMSVPTFSQWSLCFAFHNQYSVCISLLLHLCHMPCKSHLLLIVFRDEYRSQSSPLCVFLHTLVTFSLLGPISSLIILLCNTITPSACVLSWMWQTMCHVYLKLAELFYFAENAVLSSPPSPQNVTGCIWNLGQKSFLHWKWRYQSSWWLRSSLLSYRMYFISHFAKIFNG